jgi:hypothetical protein
MIRNISLTILSVLILAAGIAAPASAQTPKSKKVGLGFILGEPTGVDMKFWIANEHALEFGAAWSLSGDNQFHFQGDYLFHRFGLIKIDTGDDFPLYFGVGGRVIFRDNAKDTVGIRFPVGLDYIWKNYPFDVFGEIVPILDVAPDTDFDLEGAIGARFWF